jgi:hypothetical protein
MSKPIKMNTLLAKVDHSTSVFKKEVSDYLQIFKNKQGFFKGEKKTYVAREGYPEDPSKMGTTKVTSTVTEQLNWMNPIMKDYLEQVFSVEATNGAGAKTVELVVDGVSFGHLTALDLMRLKSFLTEGDLAAMYNNIPVYSDSEVWSKTDDEDYKGREVLQTPMVKGVTRTTETEEVILKDPNVDPQHIPANYRATTTQKRRTIEIGDYTVQKFSGEWSQLRKAQLLDRRSKLLEAVIVALKEINDNEAQGPNLDVDQFINYLHNGK